MLFLVYGGDMRKVIRDFVVKKKYRFNWFLRMGSVLEVNVDCGLGVVEKCMGFEFWSVLVDVIE